MTEPVESELLTVGTADRYKGIVHLVVFGLTMTCAAYNLGTYACHPSRRVLKNITLYSGLSIHEALQVWYHWHA